MEDVPGIGKTTMAKAIAQSLGCTFNRIQFTPDLMPTDVLGVNFFNQKTGDFEFREGPIFSQVLLADEINRATPRTQSALLEAMQERQSTVDGETRPLPDPFLVMATQNPIELEGTYPLPEAQLDRFMFQIIIDHMPEHEELEVVRTTTGILKPEFSHAVTGADLNAFQELVRRVPVSESVLKYAVALTRASRPSPNGDSPDFINKWIAYGASVRAAQYLVLGSKAKAITQGRYHVSFEDIRSLAHPVLRHRILKNFHAESEGITSADIVELLLDAVPQPSSGM